jgi:hypothetical protein
MTNLENIKKELSDCIHLMIDIKNDGWFRLVDVETGVIIGISEDTDEVALSASSDEYRNLDSQQIKKIIFLNKAKSSSLEQAYKRKYPV